LLEALLFFLFSLYAYQSGKPEARNASYYRGRMGFYCGMLFIAGFTQLVLGAYIINNFGGGELEMGPIAVAVFVVNFPAIAVFVGLIQILNAIWGLARYLKLGGLGQDKTCYAYQISVFIGWFLQFALQVLTEVSYLPGGAESQALAAITTISVGLNLMPAYLDYKARTVPEKFDADYFGTMCDRASSQVEEESDGAPLDAVERALSKEEEKETALSKEEKETALSKEEKEWNAKSTEYEV